MAGYHIDIYVQEDGLPLWQHDQERERALTAAQIATYKAIHAAYKLRQCALDMECYQQDSSAALRALKERAG